MKRLNENMKGRFLTAQGACGEINVSRNTLMRIASEANAIVRFGKSVRIDMPVLYKHIDAVYKQENKECDR